MSVTAILIFFQFLGYLALQRVKTLGSSIAWPVSSKT